MTLTVSVWDSDRGQDDPLGSATFELQLENGVRTMTLPLEHVPGGRESTVTFTSRVELPLRPSPEPEAEAVTEAVTAGPVTRKEIRMMSPEEQQRYAAAVKKMMENTSGPESSEFFRLAGYHGWPGNGAERNYSYCEHRQETFPGWHRAYLIAFEQSLRDADRALGNDGHIGLPYWDVLARPELNGQVSFKPYYCPRSVFVDLPVCRPRHEIARLRLVSNRSSRPLSRSTLATGPPCRALSSTRAYRQAARRISASGSGMRGTPSPTTRI